MRALLVAAAVSAACAHVEPKAEAPVTAPASATPAAFYPLAVGNRWRYSGTLLGQPIDRTITIVRKEAGFFIDDANGHLAFDGAGVRDRDRYLLKAPLSRGASWTSVVSLQSVEKFTVSDLGVKCQCPAGSFDGCVVVTGQNRVDARTELTTEWTYAPGVGLVRMKTSLSREGKTVPQATLELVGYEIAG